MVNTAQLEVQRLEALYQAHILYTAPEPAYDGVAEIAAHIFGTPIAMVTFLDASRNWFKATYGLEVVEAPRAISYCTHAIGTSTPLVVPDTALHPLFSVQPPPIEGVDIRFYAAAPVTVGPEQRIGTVCVADVVPREPTTSQLAMLQHLAEAVSEMVRLRQSVARMGSLNEARHHP